MDADFLIALMSYQVKPIGKLCAGSGEPLAAGSTCYSVLVEREGRTIRLDYSEDGWDGPPEDAVGYWRCEIPAELEAEQRKPIEPHELMAFFEQISESPNPMQEKLRYVLALLLTRKRRLILEGEVSDGEIPFLRFAGAHGEGTFDVRDQQLDESEIQQLQHQLDAWIHGEWSHE